MKPRADAVVKAIKEAQEAKTNGYKQAAAAFAVSFLMGVLNVY